MNLIEKPSLGQRSNMVEKMSTDKNLIMLDWEGAFSKLKEMTYAQYRYALHLWSAEKYHDLKNLLRQFNITFKI